MYAQLVNTRTDHLSHILTYFGIQISLDHRDCLATRKFNPFASSLRHIWLDISLRWVLDYLRHNVQSDDDCFCKYMLTTSMYESTTYWLICYYVPLKTTEIFIKWIEKPYCIGLHQSVRYRQCHSSTCNISIQWTGPWENVPIKQHTLCS